MLHQTHRGLEDAQERPRGGADCPPRRADPGGPGAGGVQGPAAEGGPRHHVPRPSCQRCLTAARRCPLHLLPHGEDPHASEWARGTQAGTSNGGEARGGR